MAINSGVLCSGARECGLVCYYQDLTEVLVHVDLCVCVLVLYFFSIAIRMHATQESLLSFVGIAFAQPHFAPTHTLL